MRFKQYLEAHPFYGNPDGAGSMVKKLSRDLVPKQGAVGRIHQHAPTPHRPCGVDHLTPPKRFK